MNCPKCNFNNAFGNYCRKCGSSLDVRIAFPTKSPAVPNNSVSSKTNDTTLNSVSSNENSNKTNLPKSSYGYQQQRTLNTSNKWFI